MKFNFEETSHILISVVTISLAFATALTGEIDPTPEFANTFLVVLTTVGVGFILHELAHKFVALRYGAMAEYRAWTVGLVAAVVMAVTLRFVFAAPGAVYIYGKRLGDEANGKIAFAGPAMNAVLAIGFIALAASEPSIAGFARTGASVNAFLGFFNLFPFYPMDGEKVRRWNSKVWLGSLLFMLVLLLFIG